MSASLPMTASFNRRRRRIRSNEAAIAGVILRPRRIGNLAGRKFGFSASAETPLGPADVSGACVEVRAGVAGCPAVAAAALINSTPYSLIVFATQPQPRQPDICACSLLEFATDIHARPHRDG